MTMNTKGVLAYLAITFGLAWSAWWIAMSHVVAGTGASSFQLYLLPGAFAPAIASFLVRRFITREGFADAGLALNLRGWVYYLIGWMLPFLVVGIVAVEALIFKLGSADFSMAHGLTTLAPHSKVPKTIAPFVGFIIPVQLAINALLVTPLLFGEEFGWRGYLQLRLFPSRPLLAALSTGFIWGLWHWPLIAHGYEFPGNRFIALAVFCVGTMLLSIIFGWLRNKGGSIWVTSLAHSATNAIGGSLTLLWFADSSRLVFVGYLGILSWLPFGAIALWIALQGGLATGDTQPRKVV
jgi:membrane protease YdiL (CAAX protease family)